MKCDIIAFHRRMVDLLQTSFLKKTSLPLSVYINVQQFLTQWRSMIPTSHLYTESRSGLSFPRTNECCHSHCDFISTGYLRVWRTLSPFIHLNSCVNANLFQSCWLVRFHQPLQKSQALPSAIGQTQQLNGNTLLLLKAPYNQDRV